jgi:hypothetical protein
MITPRTAELLQHVKNGILDPADTALLEQVSAAQMVAELRSSFPVLYQERRIGRQWEISLARSVRAELRSPAMVAGALASFRVVHVYVNCVTLVAENDRVTGITREPRITVWAVRRPEPGLAVKSGSGFKLDLFPDGWMIQPIGGKRTVKLSEQLLRKYGWRFDLIWHPHSSPQESSTR